MTNLRSAIAPLTEAARTWWLYLFKPSGHEVVEQNTHNAFWALLNRPDDSLPDSELAGPPEGVMSVDEINDYQNASREWDEFNTSGHDYAQYLEWKEELEAAEGADS